MLPRVTHIDHYIRGRTWLSPTFAREHIDKRGAELENCKVPDQIRVTPPNVILVSFTPEEIENFKKDHQAYQKFRKGTFSQLHNIHGTANWK
jgi:hypothetical protein